MHIHSARPGEPFPQRPVEKLFKAGEILVARTPDEMYRGLVSQWKVSGLVLGAAEPPNALTDSSRHANLADFTERMMFFDSITYLPDDILAKVDRASMGVSLEAREPLLDHRLFEFAWSLPLSMKVNDGEGKRVLRSVLYKYVPATLIDRPKMGFGMPIDRWLRGPLRDWAENLLEPGLLRADGLIAVDPVRRAWAQHLSRERDRSYDLWTVLSLGVVVIAVLPAIRKKKDEVLSA